MKRLRDAKTMNKSEKIRRIIILAAVCLFAASCVTLAAARYLIPSPFAEFAGIGYTFALAGEGVSWLFAALSAVAVGLCIAAAFAKGKAGFIFGIAAAVLAVVDMGLHSYAFLASGGYNWNYFASAVLDAVLTVCLVYRPGRKDEQ